MVLMLFLIVAMFLSVLTEYLLIVSRCLWIADSCSTMGLMVAAGGWLVFLLVRNITIEVMIIHNESMIEMIMPGIK